MSTSQKHNVIQIAKTAHAAHRAFCINVEQSKQPTWPETTQSHKLTVYNSIKKILSGELRSPQEAHENFVNMKLEGGWVWAPVHNVELKHNPRLTAFDKLTPANIFKDIMFFDIVMSFKK